MLSLSTWNIVSIRKTYLGIILASFITILWIMFLFGSERSQIRLAARDTILNDSNGKDLQLQQITGRTNLAAQAVLNTDKTKVNESTHLSSQNTSRNVKIDMTAIEHERTSDYFVHKMVPSDFRNDTYFEPYCAMKSNAYKYLIWPDTPSDFTDWTSKRKRKCPKYVIPEGLANKRRLKYSLSCDKNKPRLEPSFTYRSDDVQVVALNDTCLAKFTNRCCNDSRGIPNIVHYVWYFQNEMKFPMFLSLLSVIRYVRPCFILFHGEYLPYGKYWDYIIRIYPNVLHCKRPRPLYIFGKTINFHEHSGDIMRLEALQELGGIYFDTDVIVLRDLEALKEFDMTLCLQNTGYMLNSFIMAKTNATFLTLWMEGYRHNFRKDDYSYNSMFYNRDIAQKRPDLIHVEHGTLCAPDPLINQPVDSKTVGQYDWSGLYGFHIYARIIKGAWDFNWIRNLNFTLGSMFRQVVFGNKELCE